MTESSECLWEHSGSGLCPCLTRTIGTMVCVTNEIVLGGLSFSGALFEAEPDTPGADTYWMDCVARLALEDVTAEVSVWMIEPYRQDMLGFFQELASVPERWLGRAEWESENGKVFLDVGGYGSEPIVIRAELAWSTSSWLQETRHGTFGVTPSDLKAFAASLPPFLRLAPEDGVNLGTTWSVTEGERDSPSTTG